MSSIFQLFKKKPEEEFVFKLMKFYGFKNLDENFKFSIYDLEKLNTIDQLNNIKNELEDYYVPCKFKKYADNIDIKKSITLLRHFLRIIDYSLIAKEKYSNGRKFLLYHIHNNKILSPSDYKFTINFN